ncbi:hypothetical protein HDU99_005304 [Rhizoclosmatium hyalinum]|nr:hypothetical protein HDU99_005304 [Rhizoclosmatium hyalinum]
MAVEIQSVVIQPVFQHVMLPEILLPLTYANAVPAILRVEKDSLVRREFVYVLQVQLQLQFHFGHQMLFALAQTEIRNHAAQVISATSMETALFNQTA